MKWLGVAAAAGVLFCCGGGFAEDLSDQFMQSRRPVIDVGAFMWFAASRGETGYPSTFQGSDNRLDFRDDLGFGPSTSVPLGKVHIYLSQRWLMRLEYWQMQQQMPTTLQRNVVFGTRQFPQGSSVNTRNTVQSGDLIVGYQVPLKKNLDIIIVGGLNVFDFEQQLQAKTDSSEFHLTQTSSLLGVAGQYDFNSVVSLWSCSMGYLRRGLNADEFLLRTDTALQIRLFDTARFSVGYKSFWISAKDATCNFNYRLMGPYAGFSVAF